MIQRFKLGLVVVALAAASLPAFAIFASSKPVDSHVQAQTAASCTDAAFLTEVGKDFTDLGPAFKGIDPKAADSTAAVILQIATVRQKYEDMTVAPECLGAQVQVIVTLANGGDLASLVIASQVDKTTDPKVYSDALTRQAKRFSDSATTLTNMIKGDSGATPAATAAS
jgi:hypothetical protein